MSRRDPVRRADLPQDETPSPEVLDELLRAFSADPSDQTGLDRIDLSSPEVAELLAPTPVTEADEEPPPPEEPAAAVEEPRLPDDPPVPEDPAAADAEPVESAPPPVAARSEEAEADAGPAATDDEIGAPSAEPPPPVAARPTVLIVDDEVADEAEPVGVAGDPLLAAPVAPAGETAAPPGPQTISIVDDGIPDSIYIGGNLEATDASRSTVVIEDREGAIPTTMSLEDASSATKIEPRLRDRRIAVKRAAGRKRLKWAAIIVLVLALVVAALAVLGSGLFAIEAVEVQGAEQTEPAALAPVIEDLEGTPVLRADTDAAERELEKLPWVEEARVTTQFPDGATIELRERAPAAAFQGDDGAWRLVDDRARVLAVSAEQPARFLPIVGRGFPPVTPGQFGPPGLAAAAILARSLTPTVATRTADIEVTPDGSDLRLHFTDGAEVRFGAAEDLVQKLVRLETKLNDLGGDRVNYIDVSTNEVGQG